MSEQDEKVNHVYAKLRVLSEASKWLEENWHHLSFEDRDKGWWQVHKASREVWNILHPPKKGSKKSLLDAVNAKLKGMEI